MASKIKKKPLISISDGPGFHDLNKDILNFFIKPDPSLILVFNLTENCLDLFRALC